MKNRIIFLIIFLLAIVAQSEATTITIQSQTISNWQFATSAPKLRIHLDRGFITSDGIPLQPTAPGSRFFYKEITCTLLSNTLTIPSFTLDSTTDGQDITTARYSAWFYTTSGAQIIGYAPFDQGFKLPYVISSTSGCSPAGTCATWSDIRINNVVPAPNLDVTTYTKAQIDAKISGVAGVPLARTLTTTSPVRIDGGASADLSSNRTISLSYTPENFANRNVAGGYAPLDGSILVPLVNIPTITNAKLQNSTINFSGDGATITGGGSTALGSSATQFSIVADSVNQRVQVLNNGSSIGTRKAINFIPGSNVTLTINDNSGSNRVDLTINSTASGTGDASTNTSTSVDSEVVLFSSTTGKLLKRASGTGVAHLTSGVLSVSNVNLTSEVTGILPIVNGGTGSSTQNFVDLTTGQTVAGNKNLTGITKFQNSTVNEAYWASTGGTVLLANGADTSSGSPSSSGNPSLTFQTYRSGGSAGVGVFGYQFGFYKLAGPGDTYGVGVLNYYAPDMNGFAAGTYYQHGIDSRVVINAQNIGAGVQPYGFNLLKSEKLVVNGYIVGGQLEGANSSSADAAPDGNSVDSTIAALIAGGGTKHNSIGVMLQAGQFTSFQYGVWAQANSVHGIVADYSNATYVPQGTVAVNNGSSSWTGTSSNYNPEIQISDQITLDGSNWYEVATRSSDTAFTTTTTYAGSNTSGQTITKAVQPLRLLRPSYITATDTISTFKLLGMDASNRVRLDNNGQGVFSGANLTVNFNYTNQARLGFANGDTTYPGLWFGSATPSLTNYSFLFEPFFSNTILNGPNGIELRVGNVPTLGVDATALYPNTTTNTIDLGKSSLVWKTIYIGTSTSYTGVAFASLGTPANGTETFCTDCDPPTAVNQACASAGAKTGAKALRRNSAWICY